MPELPEVESVIRTLKKDIIGQKIIDLEIRYSKMILVVGTIFPIEYFPQALQPIIKFSPIYVVSYGPAKLFVDFSFMNWVNITIAQFIYLGIAFLICHGIYYKGVKKLNVNGG